MSSKVRKNLHIRKKNRRNLFISAIFFDSSKTSILVRLDKLVVFFGVYYPTMISELIFLISPFSTSPGPNS